jgi:hypothetical protein
MSSLVILLSLGLIRNIAFQLFIQSSLQCILTNNHAEKVAAPVSHAAQQIFDLLHGKRIWLCTTVFPTVYGRKGDPELGGKFLLRKTRSFTQFTDQAGYVSLGVQGASPLALGWGLNKSDFMTHDMSDDISCVNESYCQIVFTCFETVMEKQRPSFPHLASRQFENLQMCRNMVVSK